MAGNSSGLAMMLKGFGIDPAELENSAKSFVVGVNQALTVLNEKLNRIESKLDAIQVQLTRKELQAHDPIAPAGSTSEYGHSQPNYSPDQPS